MRVAKFAVVLALSFVCDVNAQKVTEWQKTWRDAKKISIARPKSALAPKMKDDHFAGTGFQALAAGDAAFGYMETYQFHVTRVLGPKDMLLSGSIWVEDYPTKGFAAGDSVRVLGPIEGREFACYETAGGSFKSARVVRLLPKANPCAAVSGKRAEELLVWPAGRKVLSPHGVFREWTAKKVEGRLLSREDELTLIRWPVEGAGNLLIELRNGKKVDVPFTDLTYEDVFFVAESARLAHQVKLFALKGAQLGAERGGALDVEKLPRDVSHIPFRVEQVIGPSQILLSRIRRAGLPAPRVEERPVLLSQHASDGVSEGEIVQLLGPVDVAGPGTYLAKDGAMKDATHIYFFGDSATIKTRARAAAVEWEGQFRTWTSTADTTVEARMIGRRGQLVQLKKRDGTKINIPLSKLSNPDQDHVKDKRRGSAPRKR